MGGGFSEHYEVERVLEARIASLEGEREALHKTRRDGHLELCKAGIRTHYLIGEGNREVGLVERIGLLRQRAEAAEQQASALAEALKKAPLLPSVVNLPFDQKQARLIEWAGQHFEWQDGVRAAALSSWEAAREAEKKEQGNG